MTQLFQLSVKKLGIFVTIPVTRHWLRPLLGALALKNTGLIGADPACPP
jgi:hypothetical protein